MKISNSKKFDNLLIFSMFFTALWFFGNLYEEIVSVPNHVKNSYYKLQLWHQYFTITNQVYFYVPFTQVAVAVNLLLFIKSRDKYEKVFLKKATILGFLAILLTILIVTRLNVKLYFSDNLDRYKDELNKLSVIWLCGNALRMILVGSALFYIFKTFTIRQRQSSQKPLN